MSSELNKIVGRVKQVQVKIQKVMKDQDWLEEARKYAEKQGNGLRKLFTSDSAKVEAFLERQKKELARIQKRIPGEVKKYRSLLQAQSKELEKILGNVMAGTQAKAARSKSRPKAKASSKAPAAKRKKKANVI
ncbi:MAG: hypothetical protein P4M08_07740 [Oligoflexia bacterium]|nr:hypothetical protein [Oligoflexia bacterium]